LYFNLAKTLGRIKRRETGRESREKEEQEAKEKEAKDKGQGK